jgi:hypothetical protein
MLAKTLSIANLECRWEIGRSKQRRQGGSFAAGFSLSRTIVEGRPVAGFIVRNTEAPGRSPIGAS